MHLKKTTHMKHDIINQAQVVVSILYSLHIRMCILYKYILQLNYMIMYMVSWNVSVKNIPCPKRKVGKILDKYLDPPPCLRLR